WGHGQDNTYVVGVVFNKKHGKLTSSDKEKIDNTIRFLKDNKKKLGIKSMMTPNDNYATKAQLISKDKTTEIVQLNIANDHSTVSNVNKSLTKAVKTSGIRTYVTGVRILEDDFSASVQEGIKKTELITIFFIFIVLVIVFKSPIVPIISLLTVGVSFITSFSIVTNLVEKFNFPFSNFTQVFMVIVLFGIGTDYNILLYDKFKENLSKGMSNHDATNDALRKAGKTILYSGSSILIGFSALGLAKFSIYQSAVGVAVLLVVLLTLNPFFMAVLGKKLFWPVKNFEGESNSKLWHALSKGSLAHPIIYLVVMAVVVLPFCLFYSNNLNYNDADEISDSTPSKAGLLLLQDHFSEGTPEYSTLYIQSGHKLDNEKSLKEIDQIVKKIQADPDVKFASSVTEPNGKSIKRLYVDNQLGTVNSGVNTARNGLGTLSNGSKQITNGAVQLQNGANQLASGTSRLQTGANALRAGTMQLATGAGRLESGTLNLQQGAVQLENGTIKLVNGAVSLQSGTASLQDGTQALVDGLNTMSAQLSGQMSNANKAQLLELQQGLPKINSGIQKLNQALGKSNSVDTASLRASLTDVGTQAKTIGDNLTQAGNTLKGLQNSGATGLSDSEKAELTQAYAQAMDSAKLNDQQKQAMSAALNQILGKVESASSQKSQALTSSLKSVAGNIQAAGEADKKLGQSASSVGATLQNLQGMMSQVATLKQEVNTLATASNKALPGATTALNQLSSGLTQVQSAVAQGAAGASRLNDGASRLNNGAGQLATGLQAGVSGSSQLANGAGQLANGAGQLNTGLQAGLSGTNQLANGIGQLNGGAGQLASGAGQLASGIGQLNGGASQLANGAGQIASNNPKITAGIDKVNSGLGEGQEYLTGLADSAAGKTFYIPAKMIHSSTFKPALDNYMSSDLKSTKIIIILKLDPASTEGAKKAHELSNMVKKSVKGTSLQSSTIAMGGQSEKIYDTQETASSDFLRTAIIMLVGIGIALIFVTRSVLQPLFILGTLVIAYLTSLSINQWLVHALLGRSLLAWNTPFFSFIMIVALGVDYSIFLMMRYRELGEVNPGWTTSEKMLQACDIIGTVVISAAIILGGTFAALIPSGVPTLIEVALCVDIGLLLLVFLLPINMSAAMKITYEGLGRKKNKKDAE
ncbi:MAG: MMPL family transporter, partial [Lactobacillus paragasseri]